jgi:signal peptide peptidase SppA
MRARFVTELIRYPWAILESYVPIITGILSRLIAGESLGASDLERVRERRREWDARHDTDPSARVEQPYQMVPGAGSSGAIAVIGVYGVLSQRGGVDMDTSEPLTSTARLARAVQLAAADPQIGGIVLDVDSPGGSVYGLQELGDAIHAAREAKPIAAVANSLAASAAYWTASQAAELFAAPGAEVGSIGVYTMHTCIDDLLRQKGVAVELIAAGKFKTEGNPYGPLTDEARAHIQESVDQYYDSFVRAVARGRGVSLKAVREGMGEGRVLQPDAAKAEGMIDGILTLDQVIARMQSRTGRSRTSTASSPARSTLARMQRELEVLQLS